MCKIGKSLFFLLFFISSLFGDINSTVETAKVEEKDFFEKYIFRKGNKLEYSLSYSTEVYETQIREISLTYGLYHHIADSYWDIFAHINYFGVRVSHGSVSWYSYNDFYNYNLPNYYQNENIFQSEYDLENQNSYSYQSIGVDFLGHLIVLIPIPLFLQVDQIFPSKGGSFSTISFGTGYNLEHFSLYFGVKISTDLKRDELEIGFMKFGYIF